MNKIILILALIVLNIIQVNAVTCQPNEQQFDGLCYKCDPQKGYISFDPNNRAVVCTTCQEGFYPDDNQCKQLLPAPAPNGLNAKIDYYAGKISAVFKTQNLLIGYAVMLMLVILIIKNVLPEVVKILNK